MRKVAERGAQVGWAHSPAGALRFAVRGPLDAPPLLLLHGLGDSIAGWAQAAPPLSRGFRVHLLDLPGHGLSGAPPDYKLETLVAAVAHYAASLAGPVRLVGHSLGAWVALRLVLSERVRASSLVLVNPAGAVLPREQWEPFRALVSATDAAGARAYLSRAFHRAPLALRLFPGEVVKAMAAESSRGFLAAVEEPDFLAPAELSSLRVRTRIIWGSADRLLPEGTLAFFRTHLPHAELRLLHGAGHCPHLEAPRALASAIAAPFVDEETARRAKQTYV